MPPRVIRCWPLGASVVVACLWTTMGCSAQLSSSCPDILGYFGLFSCSTFFFFYFIFLIYFWRGVEDFNANATQRLWFHNLIWLLFCCCYKGKMCFFLFFGFFLLIPLYLCLLTTVSYVLDCLWFVLIHTLKKNYHKLLIELILALIIIACIVNYPFHLAIATTLHTLTHTHTHENSYEISYLFFFYSVCFLISYVFCFYLSFFLFFSFSFLC